MSKFGELLEADSPVEWDIHWERWANRDLKPAKNVDLGHWSNIRSHSMGKAKPLPVDLGNKSDKAKLLDCCAKIANGKAQKGDTFKIYRNSMLVKCQVIFNGKNFVEDNQQSGGIGKDAFSGVRRNGAFHF